MGDDSKTFKLIFETESKGSGGEQLQKSLSDVRQEMQAATPVIRDYVAATNDAAAAEAKLKAVQEGQLGGERRGKFTQDASEVALREQMLALDKEGTEEAKKITAEEERRNALMSQRQVIIELEQEALQAQAAGNAAAQAAAERELLVRREALRLQQGTIITEEAALVMAEQKVVASEQIAASQRRQIVAEAELAAAERARVASERQITLEKEKQMALGRSLLSTAGGQLGISGVGGALAGGAAGLAAVVALDFAVQGLLSAFKGSEKGAEDLAAAADKAQPILDGLGRKMGETKVKGDELAEAQTEHKKRLDEVKDGFSGAADQAERLRRAQDQLAGAKLAADLAGVDLAEAQGPDRGGLTPEQANARRAELRLNAEREKLDREAEAERAKVRAAAAAAGDAELRAGRAASGVGSSRGALGSAMRSQQQAEAAFQAAMAGQDPESGVVSPEALAAGTALDEATRATAQAQRQVAIRTREYEREMAAAEAAQKQLTEATKAAKEKLQRIDYDRQRLATDENTALQKQENELVKGVIEKATQERNQQMDAGQQMDDFKKKSFQQAAEAGLDGAIGFFSNILADEQEAQRQQKEREGEQAKRDQEIRKKATERVRQRQPNLSPRGTQSAIEREIQRMGGSETADASEWSAAAETTDGAADKFGAGVEQMATAAAKLDGVGTALQQIGTKYEAGMNNLQSQIDALSAKLASVNNGLGTSDYAS